MLGTRLLRVLNEKFPVQRPLEGLADGNHQQHAAQDHAGGQGLEGPEKGLMQPEGIIDQELDQNRQPSGT